MFLNRATGCGSRGQSLRLRVDGSLAVNLRLAVCVCVCGRGVLVCGVDFLLNRFLPIFVMC